MTKRGSEELLTLFESDETNWRLIKMNPACTPKMMDAHTAICIHCYKAWDIADATPTCAKALIQYDAQIGYATIEDYLIRHLEHQHNDLKQGAYYSQKEDPEWDQTRRAASRLKAYREEVETLVAELKHQLVKHKETLMPVGCEYYVEDGHNSFGKRCYHCPGCLRDSMIAKLERLK